MPEEQPKDKKYIKLNTYESPYPPSPAVIEAINEEAVSYLHLYCDPNCCEIISVTADCFGVMREQAYVGNGSDEVFAFAFAAFGEAGVLMSDLTYGFYLVRA